MNFDETLIKKYNVAGPRYTSYPTVPHWENEQFSLDKWKSSVVKSFSASNKKDGISLYIHLPFCESLCTFCGCHKRITKQHSVEHPYILNVLKEWKLYCDILPEKPILKELHLGGGTPTFFSPENLEILLKGIFNSIEIHKEREFSFEGHPNNTTKEHLQSLYNLGFRRVSFGVQDYNKKIQKAINRLQPFSQVKKVTELAREIGYTSVGHDIIYGLPFQTKKDVEYSVNKTNELKPDRIAFYSYAHVPWIKGNGQRGFKSDDLPTASEKLSQYLTGKKMLLQDDYYDVGLDHFALKTDDLYKSAKADKMHRNFMGYTSSKTQLMIGLGVSSISDSWYSFAQNVKTIKEYDNLLSQDLIPVFKGHHLIDDDLLIRKHILNIMCHFKTSLSNLGNYKKSVVENLIPFLNDELIVLNDDNLIVTEKGKPFVRNISMSFDLYLENHHQKENLFSKTI